MVLVQDRDSQSLFDIVDYGSCLGSIAYLRDSPYHRHTQNYIKVEVWGSVKRSVLDWEMDWVLVLVKLLPQLSHLPHKQDLVMTIDLQ